ncbi:LOW QUALITY PROTEIN: uncharacterized protein LOC110030362 [Phalaenopsis equestris]|uniref:LOW QUALITY PROTEIN: uncharacterized protein LOC110030362 n=1 Tax=Phalaenopsis equestris TaxID=78828 RepID=UPI0009E259BA|nr:LOW QUALITY PROTEIN: uncharacterized protein LOC110030362 [Phalaenopsis equestris]
MEGTLSFSFVSAIYCPTPNNQTRCSGFFSSRTYDSMAGGSSSTDRAPKLQSVISSKTAERNSVSGSPSSRKSMHNVNTEVSPHRAVSAVRLLRIEQGGAFADLLSDKGRKALKNEMDYVERTLGFRTRDLEDRDIRLVSYIVGGAVRWRRYLDHLILSLCKLFVRRKEEKTFRNMEPLLLQILRIGFFEIIKLEMPPYAVVDENVRLAKVSLRPGAGNMVNGIMRKLVRLKERKFLPLPKVEGDERAQARALATIHSHPVWMVRRWMKSLGQEEAVKLMNWNNTDPSFCLRVNLQKGNTRADLVMRLTDMKVPHKVSIYLDDFIRLPTGMQAIIQAGLLREGLCSIQDESAGDWNSRKQLRTTVSGRLQQGKMSTTMTGNVGDCRTARGQVSGMAAARTCGLNWKNAWKITLCGCLAAAAIMEADQG